jgi:hypothetical protein
MRPERLIECSGIRNGVGTTLVLVGTAPLWGWGLVAAGSGVIVWDLYRDDVDALNQFDKTMNKLRDDVDPFTEHENEQLRELDRMQNPDPGDAHDNECP